MQLRFNGGSGAVTCSKCGVIIWQNFLDYEFRAITQIMKDEPDWYCKRCRPDAYRRQSAAFVAAVNAVASHFKPIEFQRYDA